MIIGCDLLKKLSANLNFENQICVMKQPNVKARTNDFLGSIVNNIEAGISNGLSSGLYTECTTTPGITIVNIQQFLVLFHERS